MKIRKMVGIFLSVTTALTLTACQGGAGSKETAAKNADGKNGGPVTLTFMGWEASPLETEAVKNGIAIFEKAHPNIKISYTPGLAGAEYTAKLLSTVASGTMPDVMFMMAGDYKTFVSKKALTDLTEKFSSEYPLDDFIESSKTIMQVDSKVYGVSSCTVSPIVYYNKDVFDAAGVPYPSADPNNCWTIDEFREVAKKLTKGNIYGCYGLETIADTLAAQIISNNGNKFTADLKKSAMNTPEVKEVLETILAVRKEDKSAPDATTLENVGMTATQMLQTGKVGMLIDGSWSLQELSKSGMNIGMAPLPSYGKALTTGQAHLHCIAASSPHQEEAWEFVKFLSGMEYQGALVKSGLWMPNRLSMYEPDAVAKWYDEKIHGDSYKLMLDYFKNAVVDPGALQLSSKCGDIIKEETDKYLKDGQDIDVTLANIESRTNEELARVASK